MSCSFKAGPYLFHSSTTVGFYCNFLMKKPREVVSGFEKLCFRLKRASFGLTVTTLTSTLQACISCSFPSGRLVEEVMRVEICP